MCSKRDNSVFNNVTTCGAAFRQNSLTCCLFLQVAVLSPLGRNFYLNITPNNLVRLYLRADAVPEGSPTSVRIRELSSKDWESTPTDAADSLCRSKRLSNIHPPVTNCVNGRMSADRVTPSSHHTNPVQKPSHSLTEIVTSLRNRSSVRMQAPSQPGLSVTSAPGNASVRNSVPLSCRGNQSQLDSSCRVQTAPLKPHDRSEISASNRKDDSHAAVPFQASSMSESQRMETPGGTAVGAKFRFRRTPTTPVSSQVKSTVAVQPTSASHLQCFSTVVTPTSTHHRGSLMSTPISTTVTTVGQIPNATVDDMWDAGTQSDFCLSILL